MLKPSSSKPSAPPSAIRPSLLDSCRAAPHDRDAAEHVAAILHPAITSYLDRRGAECAGSLANLVILQFLNRLPDLTFEAEGQIWSYLYRIAGNRLIDDHRRLRPEQPTNEFAQISRAADSFEGGTVDAMLLDDLLDQLNAAQREVIRLRFLEDLTVEETAQLTGRTPSSVKGLQHRALALLATAAASIVFLLLVIFLPTGASDEPNRINTIQPAEPAPPQTTVGPGPAPTADDNRAAGRPIEGPVVVGDTLVWGEGQGYVDVDVITNSNAPGDREADGEAADDTAAGPSVTVVESEPAGIAYVIETEGVPLVRVYQVDGAISVTYRACWGDLCTDGEISGQGVWPWTDARCTSPGPDAIVGGRRDDVLVGTSGPDVIIGGAGNDVIDGRGGDDVICGMGGRDDLRGGPGNDLLIGGNGDDELLGGSGHDIVVGADGADVLSGDDGDDLMYGGQGNDQIAGGQGHDHVIDLSGRDVLGGGTGDDSVFVGVADNDVIVGAGEDDELPDVEEGRDIIVGR